MAAVRAASAAVPSPTLAPAARQSDGPDSTGVPESCPQSLPCLSITLVGLEGAAAKAYSGAAAGSDPVAVLTDVN